MSSQDKREAEGEFPCGGKMSSGQGEQTVRGVGQPAAPPHTDHLTARQGFHHATHKLCPQDLPSLSSW